MFVGYARVSTLDQKLDRQIDQLEKYGIDRRNIYFEKVTGKKKERPELNRMISELVPGDFPYHLCLHLISLLKLSALTDKGERN